MLGLIIALIDTIQHWDSPRENYVEPWEPLEPTPDDLYNPDAIWDDPIRPSQEELRETWGDDYTPHT